MAHRKPLPPATIWPDRVEAARRVVLRADRMAHMDAADRGAILALAWSILTEAATTRRSTPKPAPTGPKVIALDLYRASPALAHRAAARASALMTNRRPRLVVRPVDPTDPEDAA